MGKTTVEDCENQTELAKNKNIVRRNKLGKKKKNDCLQKEEGEYERLVASLKVSRRNDDREIRSGKPTFHSLGHLMRKARHVVQRHRQAPMLIFNSN